MTGIHSGQRGSIRQGFGMIRLESSSGDCPKGMSFWEKGVNPLMALTICQLARLWLFTFAAVVRLTGFH
jgi:hypothetical protein